MNAKQKEVIEAKFRHIHSLEPSIQSQANVQAAGNKPWQTLSPGGQNLISYPALGADAVILCAYYVPPSMSGALTALAIVHNGAAGSFVDNSGLAAWHLTLNGAPVPGYETILSQLGSFENPYGIYLPLQENDIVAIWVQGPVYNNGNPAPPIGTPSALMSGYLCFGGQGTYYNPREDGNTPRANGSSRYARGAQNGSMPNQFSQGISRNRQF
jgi:hypothetical protein